MPLIREEIADDYEAVRELNRTAFEGESVAQLVDRLRSDGAVVVSLVAVEENNIVGHILFSDLLIVTSCSPPATRRTLAGVIIRKHKTHSEWVLSIALELVR
jgi:predicted N-acetyltransferase YhbS